MLKRLIEGRWLTANGVMGFWPANTRERRRHRSSTPTSRAAQVALTWYGLRQQTEKQVIDGVMRPSRCLADFVAPQGRGATTTWACSPSPPASASRRRRSTSWTTTTTTRPSCSRRWPTAWPRPSPKRCTSACARTCGAMRADEALSNEDLIAEKYRGIRPAPGYPACPDHSVKREMFELLQCAGDRHGPDREPGDDAGRQRERLLPEPSRQHLLQRRQDRRRPAAGPGARGAARTWRELERLLAPNL